MDEEAAHPPSFLRLSLVLLRHLVVIYEYMGISDDSFEEGLRLIHLAKFSRVALSCVSLPPCLPPQASPAPAVQRKAEVYSVSMGNLGSVIAPRRLRFLIYETEQVEIGSPTSAVLGSLSQVH